MKRTALADLYLHLDGSLDLTWAYQKSLERGTISPDCSFLDFYRIVYETKYASREDGFRKFDIMCDIMQLPEDLSEASFRLVHKLNEKGLIYAEMRFASQQHTKGGLSQKEALKYVIEGCEKGMKECPDIKVGVINCLMHKGPDAAFNWQTNLETIEAAREYLGRGCVGLDLAGYENNGRFLDYKPLLDQARELGIPYTIHAGEMGEGSHVLDALSMKPWRIGHGVNCVQKEEYLQAVIDSQVPLEVCVTSNVKTERNYAAHPIRELLEKGVRVTVNCDNMTFSRTDLPNEHAQLRAIGVTVEQLQQCTMNAIDAAFCDEETKKGLRKKAAAIMNE